jgi:hypothetical protein
VWGLDRVKVEKVTNGVRPSGGTPKLAFMRRNGVHAVCLDNARLLRIADETLWGQGRVNVEKVDKCGAT